LFTKNRFSQFSSIHELGKIQWQALNLAALRVGDAKERKYPGRSRSSNRSWSAWTWGGASHLWFILTARQAAGTTFYRSGRRCSCSSWSCFVLTATRAVVTPWHRQRTKVQTGPICASHAEKWEEKTLGGKEDDAMERGMCLGFVTLIKGALFISTY
jgi:hypothetical protein